MSIEASLRKYLVSHPAVSSLVGQRVSPLASKSHTGEPRLEYELIAGNNMGDFAGRSGVDRAVYQLSCWGQDYSQAKALADAVKGVDSPGLDGHRGWLGGTSEDDGGTWVQMCRVDDSSDDRLPPIDGSDEGLSRVILDALFVYDV